MGDTHCLSMEQDCVQDSDCAKYNVAWAKRKASTAASCDLATLNWDKELCEIAARETTCDDTRGCDLFKTTLKLTDLPKTLTSGSFTGVHFAGVTGDLKNLTGMTALKFLSLSNSPKITGDIKHLNLLTKLEHIDLAGSSLIHGSISGGVSPTINSLPSDLVYINFASAQGINGDIKRLPSKIEYANFREARFLWGDLRTIAGANPDCNFHGDGAVATCSCKLKELNLRNSVPGNTADSAAPSYTPGKGIHGWLGATKTDGAGGAGPFTDCDGAASDCGGDATKRQQGLFITCPNLVWVDVGKAYIAKTPDAAIGIRKGGFSDTAEKCVKTKLTFATRGCRQ